VKAAILAEENLPVDPQRQFDYLAELIPLGAARLYVLTDDPDYEPTRERSIAGIAEATGRDRLEVLYDHLAADDLLLAAVLNYSDESHDALAELLEHPATVIGLSDGGAHVRMICDAMLVHWTRDRIRGPKLPIELAVRKQTGDTARAVGLTDRGAIAVGMKADLNVIDYERLRLRAPRSVDDLPAGGWRVLQDAEGYVATIVSGVVTRRDDRDTGARPGRLVRTGP
jgi:N-acyl-D-aspartate/D-glutamate deacylase